MKLALKILLGMLGASAAGAVPVRDGPVEASLIAEAEAIAPGEPFTVALRMAVDGPWHIYWINPGDSGLAPVLAWSLPDGFEAGELQHPAPIQIPTPPFMTFGHEGVVVYLVEITPPEDLRPGPVTLSVEVDWLVCHKVCIPGFAELELTLPVGAGPAKANPEHAGLFATARRQLPQPARNWQFEARQLSDRLILTVQPPADDPGGITAATFFPQAADLIRHVAPQTWRRQDAGYALELVAADPAAALPETLTGVLVLERGDSRTALRVETPFSGANPPRLSNPERNLP